MTEIPVTLLERVHKSSAEHLITGSELNVLRPALAKALDDGMWATAKYRKVGKRETMEIRLVFRIPLMLDAYIDS